MTYALGRLPRISDPRVPHMSALRMLAKARPPVPDDIDYSKGLPQDLGMMGNDRLGDCTSAGCYHAEQIWTQCAQGRPTTVVDSDVISWYSENSGYNPQTGANDNGAIEQVVLQNWLTAGMPLNGARDRLAGFIEIDPRNLDDIRRAVWSCGVVYIGFEVPSDITYNPGSVWDKQSGRIKGGHCVVLHGFTPTTFRLVSWGGRFQMTEEFWHRYVDEAYALIDPDWAQANGHTLLGISIDELMQQMEALRAA